MRVVVIGGGITGLAAATWIDSRSRAAGRPVDLTVLEAGTRPGGHVCTVREDGFLVEGGPNGWLDREPAARALLREVGLEAELIESRPEAKRRYVVRGGRLCQVPDSPPGLFTSPALSPGGKLRLLLEPFAPGPPREHDETVYEFARRRIGHEAAEYLVDAAISGISAGDSRRLSVRAAFPIMVDMEREHGSLIRALIARRKAGTGPTRLVSLARGLGSLVDALIHTLGLRLRTRARVGALRREGGAWRIGLEAGGEIEADRVVLAVPAWRAASMLGLCAPEMAGELSAIRSAGLALVALAYRTADLGRPLDGYGHLYTRGESSDTLGVVWESTLFDGRAPEGAVLLRAMVGGVRRPDLVDLGSAELEARARRELEPLLGIHAEPVRRWVYHWPSAIAQYERGHLERVSRLRLAAARLPGLDLVGTSYEGIAFSAALAAADRLAERFVARLSPGTAAAPAAAHAVANGNGIHPERVA